MKKKAEKNDNYYHQYLLVFFRAFGALFQWFCLMLMVCSRCSIMLVKCLLLVMKGGNGASKYQHALYLLFMSANFTCLDLFKYYLNFELVFFLFVCFALLLVRNVTFNKCWWWWWCFSVSLNEVKECIVCLCVHKVLEMKHIVLECHAPYLGC